ncbi:MAG: PQQ-like beta-propeller repeat protein [Chloroflexi bacterium]|nr:MAG: PQQ-like beta-propeller repeat protein [Chloroflexota bacterium]
MYSGRIRVNFLLEHEASIAKPTTTSLHCSLVEFIFMPLCAASRHRTSYDKNLYAFNATTGHQEWVTPTDAGRIGSSSPAVTNGVVYVGSSDNKLYAFSLA